MKAYSTGTAASPSPQLTLHEPKPIAKTILFSSILKRLDFNNSTHVPFEIDWADLFDTVLSNRLSNMPWAKALPSKTMIPHNGTPPIKPLGQVTFQRLWNNRNNNNNNFISTQVKIKLTEQK